MDHLKVDADQAYNTSPWATTPRNSARSWPGCNVIGTTCPASGLVSLRPHTINVSGENVTVRGFVDSDGMIKIGTAFIP